MKKVIIYHSVDWDGYMSAAIAHKANPDADLYPWNYGEKEPEVSEYDEVILVDLTISDKGDYSWMVNNAHKLVWIDHHEAAVINARALASYKTDACSFGIGACVLTWKYFFPNKEIPRAVKLAGTYDTFCKTGEYVSWENAWNYQMYLHQFGSGSGRAVSFVWRARKQLSATKEQIRIRTKQGRKLEQKRHAIEIELFKSAVYTNVDNVPACKLCATGQPSMLIKSHMDEGKIQVFLLRSEVEVSPGLYSVSIRVSENSDFNACEFATKYGGGGHMRAAGCRMTPEEWEQL